MLINFKKFKGTFQVDPVIKKFLHMHIDMFIKEFDMLKSDAISYLHTKEGLNFFVQFLKTQGYECQAYFLPIPVTHLTQGSTYCESPSYGIIIPDNDPKRVEWFLRET